MKIKKITGVHIRIDFPLRVFWGLYPNDPKRAEEMAVASAKREADKFMEFLKDHRSRDGQGELVIETEWVCSFCGRDPEENEDGPACCDEAVKEWDEAHETKVSQ